MSKQPPEPEAERGWAVFFKAGSRPVYVRPHRVSAVIENTRTSVYLRIDGVDLLVRGTVADALRTLREASESQLG